MTGNKQPISVTIVACVYILVGAAGFIFHFHELLPLNRDGMLVEVTEFLALLGGVFLLRGKNWARWLALAWMAFHVILSAFHPLRELAVHAALFVVIAWILLRPAAGRYFRGTPSETD
jgi:hypothetical protein